MFLLAFGQCEDTGTQLLRLGGLIVPEIDPWRQGSEILFAGKIEKELNVCRPASN